MLSVVKGSCRLVSTDFGNNRLKTTEHQVNALTRLLCEVLIFTPVSLVKPDLDLRCAIVVVLKARPNLVGFLKTLDA
jgi:hypothetical protein